jgi:uncharacterized protein
MVDDSIDFPSLIETALVGVVREVLRQTAEDGLPGGHHFYLSFDTTHHGVEMPDRLRRCYPEEMTVVLEHQFWDLDVDDQGFAVTLSFDRVRERLKVPFAALLTFVDPSVPFGLRFGEEATGGEEESDESGVTDAGSCDEAGNVGGGRVVEFRKRGE